LRRPARRKSIRKRLLARALPLAIAPTILLGVVALLGLNRLADETATRIDAGQEDLTDDVIGGALENQALVVAQSIDDALRERIINVQAWAAAPSVIGAAEAAHVKAVEQSLTSQSIEELEQAFEADRSLRISPQVQDFLGGQVERSGEFVEAFITDRNGFNAVTTAQTSDFVQSDEQWWTEAWTNGLFLGEPEFDQSADVFAVDVAIRIDRNEARVGVLKAVLSLSIVQALADRATATDPDLDVTIVTSDGFLLAETSSDHDPNRIMADATNVNTTRDPTLLPGFAASDTDGSLVVGDVFVGHAQLETAQWSVATGKPRSSALAPLESLSAIRTSVEDSRALVFTTLAAIVLVALLASFVGTVLVSRQIVQPVLALRDAADRASSTTLPEVIRQLQNSGPDDPLPRLEPIEITSGDEVEALAESFTSMQYTAARLAAEQVQLRQRKTSEIFVSLGRRNQNLINRQIEYLDRFEHDETDPDALGRLFELDHLATRIRRNAENLLVLAGERPPRRWEGPVLAREIVQAAVSEVEQYQRVDLSNIEPIAVDGDAASDTSHLLAELIENALAFSPPKSTVRIVGQRLAQMYVITVQDNGIGMDEGHLAEANTRLSAPLALEDSPTANLGLFVVGHLAARHDMTVTVQPGPSRGTVAQIELPLTLLAEADPTSRNGYGGAPAAIGTHAEIGQPEEFGSGDRYEPAERVEIGGPLEVLNTIDVDPAPNEHAPQRHEESDRTPSGFIRRTPGNRSPVDIPSALEDQPTPDPTSLDLPARDNRRVDDGFANGQPYEDQPPHDDAVEIDLREQPAGLNYEVDVNYEEADDHPDLPAPVRSANGSTPPGSVSPFDRPDPTPPETDSDDNQAARLYDDLAGVLDGERAAMADAHDPVQERPPVETATPTNRRRPNRQRQVTERAPLTDDGLAEVVTTAGFTQRQPGTHSNLVQPPTANESVIEAELVPIPSEQDPAADLLMNWARVLPDRPRERTADNTWRNDGQR